MKCLGKNSKNTPCKREGKLKFFYRCHYHKLKYSTILWLLIFTIIPGIITYYSFFSNDAGKAYEQSVENGVRIEAMEAYIKKSNSTDFNIKEATGFSEEQLIEIAKSALKESKSAYTKGLAAFTLKDYLGALQLFKKAKSYNKFDHDIYYFIGTTYLQIFIEKSGLNITSEISFMENLNGIKQEPDIKYLKENILTNYDKALNLKENLDYVYYNKSIVFYYLGNYIETLRNIDKAIEINPIGTYINQKGIILSDYGTVSNDLNYHYKALKEFKKSITLNPKKANRYVNIGLCYTRLKDYENGIFYFKKALELKPNLSLAHFNLGALYAEMGKYELAVQYISKAIELNKRNSYYYLIRSKLYVALNKNHLAKKDLEKHSELKNNGLK